MATNEKKLCSIRFMFDQPEVLDAQQAFMTKEGLDDNGVPIPDFSDYISLLLKAKRWAAVLESHIHEFDRTLTVFSFSSRPETEISEERLLESAVTDMFGLLREMKLEEVKPVMVELQPFAHGEFEESQDMTIETIAFLGQLASLKTITPEDFFD